MTSRHSCPNCPPISELQAHGHDAADASVEQLFRQDTARARTLPWRLRAAAGLLQTLAEPRGPGRPAGAGAQAGLRQRIAALLRGEHINNTEDRPALHTCCAPPAVTACRQISSKCRRRGRACSSGRALNRGEHKGYSGEALPMWSISALAAPTWARDWSPRHSSPSTAMSLPLRRQCGPGRPAGHPAATGPETTLFIVCSKSFRTEETLTNSLAARTGCSMPGPPRQDLDKHFLAVTTNLQAAAEFGIPADNCLPMWDWVGGRYSVWSAVGLSCAIAVGWDTLTSSWPVPRPWTSIFATVSRRQYAAADEPAGGVVLQFLRRGQPRGAAL